MREQFENEVEVINNHCRKLSNRVLSDMFMTLSHPQPLIYASSSGMSRRIADVNIIVPNKVVEVTFMDGDKQKAVCQEPDVFSLEQAISICITKHLLGGTSIYNKAIREGVKLYNKQLETDMQIKDGKLIININSDLEKVLNSNKMVLSSVKVGDIINDKYIVLEHFADGTTVVIRKDLLDDVMEFGESNNDWRESNIRKYLNNDYLKEIEKEFGVDNVVEHTTNLFSMDGLDDYGTCRDKVGLLDIDQYRKYRKVLSKHMDSWWWLLTPDSTPSGWSAQYVRCVGFSGDVYCDDYVYSGSVRPFYILKSSIFVSCDKTTA